MAGCDCPPQDCAESQRNALAGDGRATAELIRKFTPLVGAVTRRVLGEGLHAEWDDARQEALLSIFRGLNRWSGRAPFCKWVAVVAARRAITYKQYARRHRERSRPLAPDAEPDPRPLTLTQGIKECIEQSFERLPEEHRRIYDLMIEGKKREEIAEALGLSVRSVYSRVMTVREQLRHCLEA